MGPDPIMGIHIRHRKGETYRREGHIKMETEIRIMQRYAKDCRQQPEARRKAWNGSPQMLQKEPTLATP